MKVIRQLLPIFGSLLPSSPLLLLILISHCAGSNVRQNDNNGLVCWSMMMLNDHVYIQLGDAVDCFI